MEDVRTDKTLHISSTVTSNASQNQTSNSSKQFYLDEEGEICEVCKLVRGGSWVVQCDGCNLYFHFNCVRFDAEEVGEEDPWFCAKCTEISCTVMKEVEVWNQSQQHSTVNNTKQAESTRISHRVDDKDQKLMEAFIKWKSMQPKEDEIPEVNPRQSTNELLRAPQANDSIQSGQVTHQVVTVNTQVHADQSAGDTMGIIDFPIDERREQSVAARSVVEEIPTGNNRNRGHRAKSPTSNSEVLSYKSASSKRSIASQRAINEQRLKEELELQAKLDEERMALKMEALKLKENREKRFLDEKFKMMEGNESETPSDSDSVRQTGPKNPRQQTPQNDTANVLRWIENQRKRRTFIAQNIPNVSIDVSSGEINKIIDRQMSAELRAKMRSSSNQADKAATIGREGKGQHSIDRPDDIAPPMDCEYKRQNVQQSILPEGRTNSTFIDNHAETSRTNQRDCQMNSGGQFNAKGQIPINPSLLRTRPTKGSLPQDQGGQQNQHDQIGSQVTPSDQQKLDNPTSILLSSQIPLPWQTLPQNVNQTNVVIPHPQGSQLHGAIPKNQPIYVHKQLPSNMDNNQPFPQLSSQGHWLNQKDQRYQPNLAYGQRPIVNNQPYMIEEERPLFTFKQIATRQVKDSLSLPIFSGNPADWPEFIQRFKSTTLSCGIDNSENLDRLRKCLKGVAKTAVAALLSRPECVPDIISELEDKYGRKEFVVKAVLQSLRDEPQIKADKLEELSDFGYKVRNAVETIKMQEMIYYLYNPELVQELVDKLPHQTKIDWARYSKNIPEVTAATLSEWLMELSRSINRITVPSTVTTSEKTDNKKDQKNFKGGTYINVHEGDKCTHSNEDKSSQDPKCKYCQKGCKNLVECSQFKAISVDEKWKFLYGHRRICRGCLQNHGGYKCPTTKECGTNGCTYKHHPILHDKERMFPRAKQSNQTAGQQLTQSTSKPSTEIEKADEHQKDSNCNTHRSGQSVLYKIIPVKLMNGDRVVFTFAYLDEGSGLTLLDRKLAEELELSGTPQKLCLKWTSGTVRQENDSMRVVLRISGKGDNQHCYQIRDVRTVNSLDLPRQRINKEELVKEYPYLKRIPFEDFEDEPRILIGLDNIKLGLSREYVEGRWTEPIASKTLLGWVVHGQSGLHPDDENQLMQHHLVNVHQCECESERDDKFHKQIEEYFSLENFGIRPFTQSTESLESQRAMKIMKTSTTRIGGRFETSLLWKCDDVKFPDNFSMAMKRLECQERRIRSNPALMENMNNQIRNFIVKGYARKLTPMEINVEDPRIWYLPVFHYLDPKKPEKVRLVWDAAAKYKGMSLNSMLMTGPDNLVALIDILRRYREKRVAIGGDLEEMYHQVRVKPKDQNSQRFLWRNAQSDAKPDVYVMEVLTFGTNCSPSLAQHVKDRNATEFENEYPNAAAAIKENHYVDDWLDSTHTVEEAIGLAKEVKYVHQQGGFNLRKFVSNSKDVLTALGDDNVQQSKNLDVNKTLNTQKILGMWWDAEKDCFTYSLKYTKLNEEVLLGLRAPTKREALKTLMSIYDPLGLIAFFLVYLKMLLQEVWREKIAWDEQLPEKLHEKWKRWIRFLPSVEDICIPRLYSNKISPGTPKSIQLHMFVDASEYAFCAAGYLRIEDQHGVDVVLVGAKTKVAPIKQLLTTPKLELLAAVLGTRLAKSIKQSLTLRIDEQIFWSDSRDVWCWIRSKTRKYRQFVAFRIGEILEETKEHQWRWVPGDLNVADDGTKWKKNPNFESNCRWFRGPDFLYKNAEFWPENLSSGETTEEEICPHMAVTQANPPSMISPEKFSSWSKMINVQALVTRFINKLIARTKGRDIKGPLKTDELSQAENTLYRMAQFECFHEEIELLKNPGEKFGPKSYVKKSSPLYKLSPYLDENGLLRVRGRIDNIQGVKFSTKRPVILPKHHKITELIVDNYHRMYLHGNNETVINELKQKFLIPKLRVLLKKIALQCQTCKNNKAKPIVPEMGDLPVSRLSPGMRPFTYTGVDYFGPMNVIVRRSTEKRWGVLFTCLTVRAIHIELVPSLNTDSCILGIRNFTNLRGTPEKFHSDWGTNFRGADRELSEEFKKLDKEKIQTHFTRTYTSWDFNPPAAPHFGGSWERLIASVKKNLKMVTFTRAPKEELLRSYLWEVTNIINSRPLTYVPIDSREDEVLTPNHFIFGCSNGHLAPGEFLYEERALTKAWRRSQELTNMFWRRWIKEYLPTLTCRTKWFPKARPIKPGDVVLLVDEKNARNSYPRGVVLETLPDKHGQVRQAKIRTSEVIPDIFGRTTVDAPVRYSIKTRPVAKLAVLDVVNERDRVQSKELDVEDKEQKVKPIGIPSTKGLNGEENVNDSSSNSGARTVSTKPVGPSGRLSTLRPRKREGDSRKPLH